LCTQHRFYSSASSFDELSMISFVFAEFAVHLVV
jgi:hypothetical protein